MSSVLLLSDMPCKVPCCVVCENGRWWKKRAYLNHLKYLTKITIHHYNREQKRLTMSVTLSSQSEMSRNRVGPAANEESDTKVKLQSGLQGFFNIYSDNFDATETNHLALGLIRRWSIQELWVLWICPYLLLLPCCLSYFSCLGLVLYEGKMIII